jgi:transcriptional regulator with GAF, ATPase, and Fis domain
MIGSSKAMKELHEKIAKIADSRSTVLIRGETGVGKELVARSIHHISPRQDKPFIKVNCAALSSGILKVNFLDMKEAHLPGLMKGK